MPALRSNEEKVAGFISKNVYGDLDKRPDKIGDFILRGDLSTAETSVYVNDKTKELFSMEDIDGGLIGGASLDSKSFESIINSF